MREVTRGVPSTLTGAAGGVAEEEARGRAEEGWRGVQNRVQKTCGGGARGMRMGRSETSAARVRKWPIIGLEGAQEGGKQAPAA